MASGLRLPVGVGANGGAAIVSGDAQATKIIWTALSDCDNQNAFQQDLGLGSDLVFDAPESANRGKIIRKLYAIFDEFERDMLYRLERGTIQFEHDPRTQELVLSFQYINLESDDVKEFRKVLSE